MKLYNKKYLKNKLLHYNKFINKFMLQIPFYNNI